MRKCLLGVACTLMIFATASALPQVRATWSPPTTGSPVEHYVLTVFQGPSVVLTTTTADTFLVLPPGIIEYGKPYTATVAGVDALGRTGPESLMSEPYFDAGPPGGCGQVRWSGETED